MTNFLWSDDFQPHASTHASWPVRPSKICCLRSRTGGCVVYCQTCFWKGNQTHLSMWIHPPKKGGIRANLNFKARPCSTSTPPPRSENGNTRSRISVVALWINWRHSSQCWALNHRPSAPGAPSWWEGPPAPSWSSQGMACLPTEQKMGQTTHHYHRYQQQPQRPKKHEHHITIHDDNTIPTYTKTSTPITIETPTSKTTTTTKTATTIQNLARKQNQDRNACSETAKKNAEKTCVQKSWPSGRQRGSSIDNRGSTKNGMVQSLTSLSYLLNLTIVNVEVNLHVVSTQWKHT